MESLLLDKSIKKRGECILLNRNIIKRLERAEHLLYDCETLTKNNQYVKKKLMDIGSEINMLRNEIQDHV